MLSPKASRMTTTNSDASKSRVGAPRWWFKLLRPRVPQCHGPVEDTLVAAVGHEISVPLELESLLGLRVLERRLQLRANDLPRVRVEIVEVLMRPGPRCGLDEQPVVESHFAIVSMRSGNPMNRALHLHGLGAR